MAAVQPTMSGMGIEFGLSRADEGSVRSVFAAPALRRGALFAVVEGAPEEEREALFRAICAALDLDRGTSSSRLLRAVLGSCRRLESRALHRFELAALGLTALFIEDGSAHLTQLLPSQAYVVEDGVVRAVPEVPMRGAARVGSAAGRRWEVELDASRSPVRPGAAYVLCTSGLAETVTPSKLLDAVRQPPEEAASLLAQPHSRAGSDAAEALVVRAAEAATPAVRARVFAPRDRRVSPRNQPAVQQEASSAGRGAGITAWGLRGQSRVGLRGRLGDPLPALERPRAGRRAAWLALPALVAGGGAVAWAVFGRGHSGPESPAAPPSASVGPSAAVGSPAGAAETGGTLLTATDPFISLAVANGVPRVLDAASRITQPGAPPAAPAGVGQIVALAARENETLALDASRTVWRLGEGGEAARPLALRAASLWQRPRAIAVYLGNLYVLDAGSPGSGGQIWRHTAGAGGGFDGEAQAWLAPNAGVTLDGATAMAIDGAIWVSRDDGSVLRLAAGRPEPFEPRGVERPIRTAGAVYTDRALAAVYVLDAAERRLLKLAKTGQLEAAVPDVIPIGEHVRGLWVEEAGRRALVLTDRRLREVPLV